MVKKNKDYTQCVRIRVSMGNIAFEQGKYPQAAKMYHMAMDSIPQSSKEMKYKIQRNIGHTYVAQHQYTEAIAEYEGVLEEHPDLASAFNLLLCYRALGDKAAMKDAFTRLLAIEQQRLQGPAAAQPQPGQQDPSELAGAVDPHPGEKPDKPGIAPDELTVELRARRTKAEKYIMDASKLIAPLIEADPPAGFDFVVATLRHAGYHQLAGQLELGKAVELLRRHDHEKARRPALPSPSIPFHPLPFDPRPACALETLRSFEQRDEALAQKAACNLAFVYFLEGDMTNAEKYAQMAVDADHFNALALVNLGNCKYVRGDYGAAQGLYQRALSADDECVEARYNLGLALGRLGQHEEAYACFERIHRRLGTSIDVMYQLAKTCEALEDRRRAAKWYSLITTRVPTDGRIQRRLGELCQDEGQALHFHQEAYRYDPISLDVVAWLGYYFVKCQMYEKATPFFLRASIIDPADQPKWLLLLGNCPRKMGAYEQALKIYQQAHQRFPANQEALKYLQLVCRELGQQELCAQYEQKLDPTV
ncbi:putative Intraflagellar transport protein 88 [Paratrimastix pyriformis]|uniref:Intraflagellar transport protein 88 n=1 Tax=Paratrimastix pyriformis TaxID=342808 RepID=A0ABQ8UNH2_9EUKA|nr:putative Intraflagellar transport protein 88 [Paratrimastix pyriformis]